MAIGKLERFEPGTSFTGWMGRFVKNVALDHARKVQRRGTHPLAPETVDELVRRDRRVLAGPGAERPPIDSRGEILEGQVEFDDRVLAGLRELGADQRSALLLRTVMGMSYREIASTLEIPEGTAMSHVHRARQRLRGTLSESEAHDGSPRAEEKA